MEEALLAGVKGADHECRKPKDVEAAKKLVEKKYLWNSSSGHANPAKPWWTARPSRFPPPPQISTELLPEVQIEEARA
jgi:hypothetical protein